MAFIVYVIKPEKIGLICKIHFIDGCILNCAPFHANKVAIDDQLCFFRWQISGSQPHLVIDTWDYLLASALSSSVV